MASGFDRDFPDGVKRITTGCQYCAVGCGYNAFLTPHDGGPTHLSDAPRFITPAMQPARAQADRPETTAKVFFKGELKDIAVAPDPRCDLNKGNHSVRGASQGLNLVAYGEKSDGTAGHVPVGRSTRERLTSPWIRLDSGTWKEVTWQTINKVMAKLVVAATSMRVSETEPGGVEVNNPRGLGVKLYEYQYLENTYAATKLFYGAIGTPNVAYHDRPSASGSSPGLKDAGLRPHDFSYEDIQAADLIVMFGTNPYENQSVFFMQYCQGKEIWVIDPRRTATAEYAVRTGGAHIQPTRLGADSRLIYAICRALIERWEARFPGHPYPTILEIGDTDDLTRDPDASPDKKRQASRARSFADFRKFLGIGSGVQTYELGAAMDEAGLSDADRATMHRLVEALVAIDDQDAPPQKKVAVLYEKGMIWGFNYHNTAALASLGVLLGAGSEPGRILGRVGGHQKGWAERVNPLHGFIYPDVEESGKDTRYPTHNATDRYSDRHLVARFGVGGGAEYITPKHNLDNHVFGPSPGEISSALGIVERPSLTEKPRSTRRLALRNGLETDEDPDVHLLWIIGGNYLGQTNDVAWKRKKLYERMKAGRPVNPRRPKSTDPDEIAAALIQRMADGGLVCVHQDIFPNPTTECCDIVIPAAGWGEETFCRYNAQRRLKLYERFQDMPLHTADRRRSDVDPCKNIEKFKHSPKPDWMIFQDIAQSIGAEIGSNRFKADFCWKNSAELADEMAEASHRGPDHPTGMGLANLNKFAIASGVPEKDKHKVHAVLGASAFDVNGNAEAGHLKTNYVVSETVSCRGSECTALGIDKTSEVYTNGIATNGVFLPLTTREHEGTTQLVGHLSVRREGPAFYFVEAQWEEIEDAFERINGVADDGEWRDQGGVLVTNGRVNHLWNNMFHHIRNDYVSDRYPEDMPGTVIEINPVWAKRHAIENGDIVRLSRTPVPSGHPGPHDTSDRKRDFREIVYGVASLQTSVPDGMAFLMFSYPVDEGNHPFNFNFNGYVNNITDGYADGINPIAALKYGHAILSKVPVEQSGFTDGKFASRRDRPGPLYQQRNAVGPEIEPANRPDWEMRELIVRKGLPRASAHFGKKRPLFFQPDDFFDALKNNISLEGSGPLRDGFKSGAIAEGRWMSWRPGGSLIDEWHGADVDIGAKWLEQFPPLEDGGDTEQNETGGETMPGFVRVQEILDGSVGGPNEPAGFFHGAFWRGADRNAFVALTIGQLPLIALGDGAGSNLVKALKGEAPFGSDQGVVGATIRRMPAGMAPVPPGEIAEIEAWIDAGAPEVADDAAAGGPPAISEIRVLPSLAIARFGSSSEPMTNFDIITSSDGSFSELRSAETLFVEVPTGQILRAEIPPGTPQFKDGENQVKPVCPFFELWVRFADRTQYVPLTTEHLAERNLGIQNVSWTVDVANLKIFRRTGELADRIELIDKAPITNHQQRNLKARAANFLTDKTISFGFAQFINPTGEFPEIRLRFTPSKGKVFGHQIDDNITDEDRVVYDPQKGRWDGFQDNASPTNPQTPRARIATLPPLIYARTESGQNLGYFDDSCDGIVTASLVITEGAAPLTASARISAGPPDFAPDSLPVRSVADDLKQIANGPKVTDPSAEQVVDVVRRALESVRLMNVTTMNRFVRAFTADETDQANVERRHREILQTLGGLSAPPDSPERLAAVGVLQTVAAALRPHDQVWNMTNNRRKQMPALMLGADRGDLALTRRQRNSILRAIEVFAPGGDGDATPLAAFRRLIATLGPNGAAAHNRVPIGNGATMDTLFNDEERLISHLMTARAAGPLAQQDGLAGERLVIPGDPDGSALMSMVSSPNHPMRTIFELHTDSVTGDDGVGVVRKWIASMPSELIG